MTRWGVLLLLLFLGLGLSNTRLGKAVTLAVCLTVLVLSGVMAKYVQ
jgi:hypothetical protein